MKLAIPFVALALCLLCVSIGRCVAGAEPAELALDSDPHARYEFGGVVGERIKSNTTGWLTRAPAANPGLLAMFQLRDRLPRPQLVPWAGEFVGKYLLSAIPALRMDSDPRLALTVKSVVAEVIAAQADDGYLGPFPADERLLGHWDLWGHYHIMLALMMWHEQTGDTAALDACRRAADLACQVYLNTGRRPRDAGSSEMNLSIIHGLGQLYRLTGEQRYLELMREIERDWEQEGDYLRTGLAGVEFYQTPKPRWESLHNLQGLVELFQITGDTRYRTAYLQHWDSIRRLDRRNTGGFSSGEQATGTPYEPTAIETCCTIAWMALSVDALRLTGNSIVADELERSTYNGMLGAQHPSGSWWTYDTPMNGVREASQHTIVFQARAGTPELNCCSVNGPRGLGMLPQWAVMCRDQGLAINHYGPMQGRVTIPGGPTVSVRQETRYPLDGSVKLQLQLDTPSTFALYLRIPGWAESAQVRCSADAAAEPLGGQGTSVARTGADETPRPGSYLTLRRRWKSGDTVELKFDMPLRYEAGAGEMAGRMSVYRGPLLLAYDTWHNEAKQVEPPSVASGELASARVAFPTRGPEGAVTGRFAPWIIVDIPLASGERIRLCDFASAGAVGSRYTSWLPAREIAPPSPMLDYPEDGATVPAGRLLFKPRPIRSAGAEYTLHIRIGDAPDLSQPLIDFEFDQFRYVLIPAELAERLRPNVEYYWKLVARNPWGVTESPWPVRRFTIDPQLPPLTDDQLTQYGENAEGLMVQCALRGEPAPAYGAAGSAHGWTSAQGPDGQTDSAVALDGIQGMLVYPIRAFPGDEYTVSLWVSPQRTDGPLGQVFSAWCRGMDDPLRICVKQGELFARIEAGQAFSTRGFPIQANQWYHVCVVKQADQLTLYVDGTAVETISVPAQLHSNARDIALGGNPHFTGSSEHLACTVADFAMYARALSAEEVQKLCDASGQ